MDNLKILRQKKPGQIPWWQDEKYDPYDLKAPGSQPAGNPPQEDPKDPEKPTRRWWKRTLDALRYLYILVKLVDCGTKYLRMGENLLE